MTDNIKRTARWLWLAALLVCPLVLWMLPADFFDGGVVVCPSRAWFDIECLGCGMTRAVMYFHHFDFTEAIYYNGFVIAVYPLLVLLWFTWVKAELIYLGFWPGRKPEVAGRNRASTPNIQG